MRGLLRIRSYFLVLLNNRPFALKKYFVSIIQKEDKAEIERTKHSSNQASSLPSPLCRLLCATRGLRFAGQILTFHRGRWMTAFVLECFCSRNGLKEYANVARIRNRSEKFKWPNESVAHVWAERDPHLHAANHPG